MLPYAFAIFCGAFLLFQVQPLIGKYILPWFGGGPGVWTTCLLFFQVVLLGGYGYAHWLTSRLRPRRQAMVHGVLLVAAAALLPIAPGDFWKGHVAGNPTWHILLLLGGTIGLPYFVLSSTGPLMQQWFSVTRPGVSPYRLYALSNVGSLLALLTYPTYFELKFSRHTQAALWSAAFIVFALLCAYCARLLWTLQTARTGSEPFQAASNHDEPRQAAPDRFEPHQAASIRAEPLQPASIRAEPHDAESSRAALDQPGAREAPEFGDEAPAFVDKLLWVALPATASVLLLATTNKLCQEIAVIPFLWVLPLGLYLLSFVISFDHARWYARGVFAALLAMGIALVFQLLPAGNSAPLSLQIGVYTATLFFACMVCHGELYQLKPSPKYLTSFYLAISAGGALGGFLVAIVAPAVFTDFHELPLGLWLVTYLVGVLSFRHGSRRLAYGAAVGLMLTTFALPVVRAQFSDGLTVADEWLLLYRHYGWFILGGLLIFLGCAMDSRTRKLATSWQPRLGGFVMTLSVVVGLLVIVEWRTSMGADVVDSSRNFYGTLKVYDYDADDPENHYYLLLHGATTHGLQYTADDKAMRHTTYYGETSGVGLALTHLPTPPGQRRIGLVGLGTGTLASYGTAGDYLRIYDINPAVVQLATTRFTYLKRCPAKVDIALGDARLSMERELAAGAPQRFDLLALDAFSSDAIPVHLLTQEAFAVYMRELKPGGILAVHTSNRYLDLRPVVERLAAEYGLKAATISDDEERESWVYRTTWILVTKNQTFLETPAINAVAEYPDESAKPGPLWTDDHASLFQIMR
jgi:hypothetical protein